MTAPGVDWQDTDAAIERLRAAIGAHGSMIVAFSGGVDSALLARVAHDVLGPEVLCMIGVSASLAGREERDAIAFLELHGIPFERIHTNEMDDERYRANEADRCFYCKDELFARIAGHPRSGDFGAIAYGANEDDRHDHRPGGQAAEKWRVVAPLAEAGFDKARVRSAAKRLGLAVWDKPAAPCLASRIPYRSRVTPERLAQVENAEAVLKDLGFRECRVRHFGLRARIELPLGDHSRVREPDTWAVVSRGIREAGFDEVELDSRELRSGRLNEALGRFPREG